MQYFWVNQSNFKKELELEAIVSNTNGQTNHARLRVFEVKKGDIIFSFSDVGLQAVLTAREDASKEASRCVVSCSYTVLERPFNLEKVTSCIADQLKCKYSPIDVNGNRNQGYLYPLSDESGERLLRLCATDSDASNEK